MIPFGGEVHFERKYGPGWRSIRLPLFPLWLLFWPALLLALPLILIVCLLLEVDPVDAIAAIWRVMSGLKGTHVEVDEPGFVVQISIP